MNQNNMHVFLILLKQCVEEKWNTDPAIAQKLPPCGLFEVNEIAIVNKTTDNWRQRHWCQWGTDLGTFKMVGHNAK
jgi:hypothetical protein